MTAGGAWRNWGGNVRCRPLRTARPRSVREVAEEVERAAAARRPLRVAGAGHSFSPVARSDGHLLLLDALDGLLAVDRRTGLVRAQAGMTIGAFSAAVERHGLALRNMGDIDRQTLAGALATATHGTGRAFGSLAAEVAAVQLVTGDGRTVEVGADDPETFHAVCASIGALGVVTAMTLRCVERFALRYRERPAALAETLDALGEHVARHDHFELLAFPYSDVAIARESERVEAARGRRRGRLRRFWEDAVVANAAFELVCAAGRLAPPAIPWLNRLAARAPGRERTAPSRHTFVTPRRVRFLEMEYALPRERGAEAVRAVLAEVERRRLPVGFPVEVRFAGPDQAHLSPLHGRESCFVACHAYRGWKAGTYFRAVEPILAGLGGRPHWGKLHTQDAASLRPRYPAWDRFAAVRARLDPARVFATPAIERLLGP